MCVCLTVSSAQAPEAGELSQCSKEAEFQCPKELFVLQTHARTHARARTSQMFLPLMRYPYQNPSRGKRLHLERAKTQHCPPMVVLRLFSEPGRVSLRRSVSLLFCLIA
jgi:hypothetical protein